MIGFQFPTYSPLAPELDASSKMAGWRKELQDGTKQVRFEEQKAMFEPHAAAWEDEQLSNWLSALERDLQDQDQPAMRLDTIEDKAIGRERLRDGKATNGMNILKVVGWLIELVKSSS
ncbi:hypothetical protein RSOLAG1IB_09854 [Rhizoctonia solani AG-1 IB]|uniref:Uncharacterized protein n=1 Tax=Thanatephorus cucumeris (strain AG1-IB / isolate 7/3/14) TaxID=1108050 RepID=M5CBN8_THACB|nr:hypothetical protein BN14_07311 [Rhizoctonia solani AG-1 IB]CEL61221.1 hypothetical protein RSOLAG1IB_09854 [Rhizoctonia solani AG-1 IB]